MHDDTVIWRKGKKAMCRLHGKTVKKSMLVGFEKSFRWTKHVLQQ